MALHHVIVRAGRGSARAVVATALAASVAACSGGGGGSTIPSSAPGGSSPGGGSAPSSNARTSVTFEMKWTAAPATSLRRQYLAPTAQSVSISVISAPAPYTSATPIIEVMNNPSTTLTFSAPTGQDTFLIQTFDEQNGLGNVLSKAFVTQTVSGSSTNVVSATLNGVIAAIGLTVSSLAPPAGTPATITVSANGLDADGNVIVGPGNFAAPIAIAVNDPNNTGSISVNTPNVIQAPGGTVKIAYTGGTLFSAAVTATVPGVPVATATIAPTPTGQFFSLPSGSNPKYITVDKQNNLWFTLAGSSAIGEFPSGSAVLTSYPTPTANAYPLGITIGTDGRIWFAENASSKLGALTPSSGSIAEFPTLFGSDQPYFVTDRGDGNMWYTGYGASRLGYENETTSAAGETTLSLCDDSSTEPTGLAEGADGYLYFTGQACGQIGRLHDLFGTPSVITIPVPSGASNSDVPAQMVKGPDGNLWFTETANSEIGRVNIPSFTVTMFQTASPNAGPLGITAGTDGALYFTETDLDRIGRITASGVATDYALPGSNLGLTGIVSRSNGQLFFCASYTNQIGRLVI